MILKMSEIILDDNFCRTWKPLSFLQTVIGSARVIVVNNVMTTRSWYHKVYGCVNVVLSCVGMFYMHSSPAFHEENESQFRSVLSHAQVIASLLLNSGPIIVNNFFNINANRKLIKSLQRIDQTLKISTNEHHYKYLYRFIAGSVICCLIGRGAMYAYLVSQNIGYPALYLALPTVLILNCHELELCLFNAIVVFMILRVRYINSLLSRSVNIKWKSLKRLETCKVVSTTLDAYRHILDVYELLQQTSNTFLLLLCLHSFINELIELEQFITLGQEIDEWKLLWQFFAAAVKVYSRALSVGILVTGLEKHILKTRLACLRVINDTTNEETRRHAKNLLRLVTRIQPMSVFGMATLRLLPLKMTSLTATYAVVLLQLTFQAQGLGTVGSNLTTNTNYTSSGHSNNHTRPF